MELAHRIVACFPLAEKPDICEQDITVLDLWLRPLFSTAILLARLTRSLFPSAPPTSVRPLGVIRRSFDSLTTIFFMLLTSGFDMSIVPKTGIEKAESEVKPHHPVGVL